MTRWMWALVAGAGLLWTAALAQADENFEQFPCEHDDGGSSTSSASSSDDSAEREVVGSVLEAFFSGASSSEAEESSAGSGTAEVELYWPEEIGFRLDAGYGALDFGPSTFADTDDPDISVLGSEIDLGQADLAGAEFAADLAPTRHFRLGGGFGFYAPFGGEMGGSLGYTRFGRDSFVEGLRVFQAFAEMGFVQRVGRLHAYAVAHAGLIRAEVDVSSSCGCNWRLAATRVALGPRLGVRAHLYKSLYLQTAVFADALEFPDYVATVGIGIGRRAR